MKLPEVSDFNKGRQAPSGGYLPMYLVGGVKAFESTREVSAGSK